MTRVHQRAALGAFVFAGAAMAAIVLSWSAVPPMSELVRFERAAARMGPLAAVNVSALPQLRPLVGLSLSDTGEPLATACFAEGTPEEVMAAFISNMGWDQLGDRWGGATGPDEGGDGGISYYLGNRWTGTQGAPLTIMWSFVPDGLSIPGSAGEPTAPSNLFATFDSRFSSQGGRATWVNRFVQVFDRWQELTGITYTRVTVGANDWDDGASWGSSGAAGLRGDIRISAHVIDGASGILAYNMFPGSGQGGNMVLDSGDGSFFSSTSNLNRNLRNTVAHENGHGMGLAHVCSNDTAILMEPFLGTGFDHARHDDTRAMQRHYGDPFENDNTPTGSTDLGSLPPGSALTPCTTPAPISGTNDTQTSICSLDANGEQDWFKFTVAGPTTVTITLTPLGRTYQDNSQAANGSCNTGTTSDSLTKANVALDLVDTDGITILASASSGAPGAVETISNFSLPGAGGYYARIYETDAPTQTQLYSLSILDTGGCVAPTISAQPQNQTTCSGGNVNFNVVAGGSTPLTYQWREGTTNLSNGGRFSGVNTPTLTITGALPVDAAPNYNVVITNLCGSITSNNASLTVNTAPGIQLNPSNQTTCAGTSVNFSVTAVGSAPLSYQWRRGTTNLVNGGNISGATTAVLTINPVQPSDAATNYNVVVTNSCGSVTSNNASLTVNAPPSITTHPQSQTVPVGGSAVFNVAATGTPTLSYQWRKNGSNIPGATGTSYSINPVSQSDAGVYDVVVTNFCASVDSNDATLTVGSGGCEPCDTNCDGSINAFDIQSFVDILGGASGCSSCAADTNGDGSLNGFDIQGFVDCLNG